MSDCDTEAIPIAQSNNKQIKKKLKVFFFIHCQGLKINFE